MIRSGPENAAACSDVYQVAVSDASIKSEWTRVVVFSTVLPVLRGSGEERLLYPLTKAVGGKADPASYGVHRGINSNSNNDDNGGSDACIAAADHNNRHRVGCSKPGVEHNQQVAHRRALRRRPETRSRFPMLNPPCARAEDAATRTAPDIAAKAIARPPVRRTIRPSRAPCILSPFPCHDLMIRTRQS